MIQDMKFFKKFKNIHVLFALAAIILVAVTRVIFIYSQRDGHHVDEVWSYGYANSYYQPEIFGGSDEADRMNYGEWISGSVFKDYISVSPDHRFSFDSVAYNSNSDLSPALYIYLLHFVCSFCPGVFTWKCALIISLLCFIPSLILIFKISYDLTKSRFCSFFCVIYYIFSGCGTGNFIYLRLYHLLTLFTLLLFFVFLKILQNPKPSVSLFIVLPFISLLGCLSHYYFLVIAFAITMFSALILLFKKRFKSFVSVCVLMLISVGAFFAIDPHIQDMMRPFFMPEVSDATNTVTGYYGYPYHFDLGVANAHFFYDTVGFCINFNIPDLIGFIGGVVFVVIIILLIVFLFRNEGFMKKIVSVFLKFVKWLKNAVVSLCKSMDPMIFVAFLASIFYLLIVPISASLTNMGFTDRYFFCGMSLFLVFYASIIAKIIETFICSNVSKKVIIPVTAVLFAILVFMLIRTHFYINLFRFRDMGDHELESMLSGKDCFVVIASGRDMTWLCPALSGANNVYIVLHDDVTSDDYEYPELDKDCVFLILRSGLMTDEQKSQLENEEAVELYGISVPNLNKSYDQIMFELEEQTGNTYQKVDEYYTFIGALDLYECVE